MDLKYLPRQTIAVTFEFRIFFDKKMIASNSTLCCHLVNVFKIFSKTNKIPESLQILVIYRQN